MCNRKDLRADSRDFGLNVFVRKVDTSPVCFPASGWSTGSSGSIHPKLPFRDAAFGLHLRASRSLAVLASAHRWQHKGLSFNWTSVPINSSLRGSPKSRWAVFLSPCHAAATCIFVPTRQAPATLVGLRCLHRGAVAMCLIVAFDVHPEIRIILAALTSRPLVSTIFSASLSSARKVKALKLLVIRLLIRGCQSVRGQGLVMGVGCFAHTLNHRDLPPRVLQSPETSLAIPTFVTQCSNLLLQPVDFEPPSVGQAS